MANNEAIANLTQHQTITDALLNSMGESIAVQQALMHIPVYDGKNMPLKTFLQDVENGHSICPEGIKTTFFKGVIAKLRDTARDAVSGVEIKSVNNLRDALKEYFAPKKNYSQFCAEIQGVRIRRNESVIEYYGRIKKIMEGAKASLNELFTQDEVPHMIKMLSGIALESFKRGLSDEFLYALSVQEPATLDAALKIAQRIERDMVNSTERKGLLQFGPPETPQNNTTQSRAPWTNVHKQGPGNNQTSSNNYRPKSPVEYRGTNRTLYEPRQASQFQGRNYQRGTSPAHSNREPEFYQRGTRPNYPSRGSGHFQQRRPQPNFYQGGWQALPSPQYPPGYMMPYQYYAPPYGGYMPAPMPTTYAQNHNNSFR